MKEFKAVYQLSKTKIFEVSFYTLGSNKHPYFATEAAEFTRNKLDFTRCGQAQKYVLANYPAARKFYEKWDKLHLKDLTSEQYEELRRDMKVLEDRYNYMLREQKEAGEYIYDFGFNQLALWSM